MMSLTGQFPSPSAAGPDPSGRRGAANVRRLGTSYFPPGEPGNWQPHVHDEHELLWGARGVLTVESDHGQYAVPAMLGLWIPAGVRHAVASSDATGFYCTHIDAVVTGPLADHITAITVAPAVRELLLHMGQFDMPPEIRELSQKVALGLLETADAMPMLLPMPSDPRLVTLAKHLLAHPDSDRSLDQWSSLLAISVRNLSRLFHRETGMTFAQWRISARMRVALGLLAAGLPVGSVGRRVGYRNSSAFVETFGRVMGCTPGAYVAGLRAEKDNSLADSA